MFLGEKCASHYRGLRRKCRGMAPRIFYNPEPIPFCYTIDKYRYGALVSQSESCTATPSYASLKLGQIAIVVKESFPLRLVDLSYEVMMWIMYGVDLF